MRQGEKSPISESIRMYSSMNHWMIGRPNKKDSKTNEYLQMCSVTNLTGYSYLFIHLTKVDGLSIPSS